MVWLKRILKFKWLLTPLLLLAAGVVWYFGSSLPYINIVQQPLLRVIFLSMLLSTILLPTAMRWIICIIFVIHILIIQGVDSLYLLLLPVLLPPLSRGKVKNVAVAIFTFLKKVPFLVFAPLLFTALIVWGYYPMQNSYFEGDEWVFFRKFMPLLESRWWWIQGFFTTFEVNNEVLLHKTPFANMLYVQEFKLFGLNFFAYLIVSLISHFLVACALYVFYFEFTKKKLLSFLTAILFVVSAVHSQGVTWIMTAIHTQYAVGFGFLSLYFTLKSFAAPDKPYTLLAAGSLLLALWSKETAIIFIPLILYLYWKQGKLQFLNLRIFGPLYIVLLIFAYTQLSARSVSLLAENQTQPWTYTLVEKVTRLNPDKLGFWYGSFLLKAISQALIPAQVILSLGIWMTDQQFPFFNQEKAVGGTTYASFIFSPAPEFVSYILSCIVLFMFIAFIQKRYQKIALFFYLYLLLSILPLLANILQFPWWRYAALVDGRHLYHITPAVCILFVLSLEGILKKLVRFKYQRPVILCVLVAIMVCINIRYIHITIDRQQTDAHFSDRRMIISNLQKKISPPPKDLIIYTSSNRSYYGFASFMLPFQTAFSHMMPVIFSKEYHLDGNTYPKDFYTDAFFEGQTNGITTQGYFEKDGFGLGYYLEEIPLIKFMERTGKDLTTVHAFHFDGDKGSFVDESENFRHRVAELLERRLIFKSWKRFGSKDEGFSFQADPLWNVTIDGKKHEYVVTNEKAQPIITIVSIKNTPRQDFGEYVLKDFRKKYGDEARYEMTSAEHDLDYPHNIYFYKTNPEEFYILSGNNEMFYKVTVHNKEKALLVIRTLEFNDTLDEDISL